MIYLRMLLLIILQTSLWSIPEFQEKGARWDGQYFYECDVIPASSPDEVIEETTIYFAAIHPFCYGHGLLDGVLPLYSILNNYNLLEDDSVNLFIISDSKLETNTTFLNLIKLIKDIFHFKRLIVINKDEFGNRNLYFKKLMFNEHVPFIENKNYSTFSFYKVFPDSFKYMLHLREYGIRDNIVFQDTDTRSNIMKDFVNYVCAAYKINELNYPTIKKRILLVSRAAKRRFLNLPDLARFLKKANNGYEVAVIDFEKLSIKEQIIETIQSEFLVGTYGSNLTNAIFLRPGSSVIVLWHKYAKYFWSRKYCILHSAFLSVGVRLIEYDKPDYDPSDIYNSSIKVPDYFYHSGKIIMLKSDKASLNAMINCPSGAMSELTDVDLFINPHELIALLQANE